MITNYICLFSLMCYKQYHSNHFEEKKLKHLFTHGAFGNITSKMCQRIKVVHQYAQVWWCGTSFQKKYNNRTHGISHLDQYQCIKQYHIHTKRNRLWYYYLKMIPLLRYCHTEIFDPFHSTRSEDSLFSLAQRDIFKSSFRAYSSQRKEHSISQRCDD